MGNGVSVKVDLTGCSVVFLVPRNDSGILDVFSFYVMDILRDKGINRIETKSLKEASLEFSKIQQTHGRTPANQKFLKITPQGSVVQLFP